ncbi:tetratricopeptide repeat protein [Aequorivita marina]|uniref:tetratricopeptide repeat protein n=1 Tax=Aequorivita marina TaxID=3073654 RepID=UPI00287537BE|nr:tetratricopeptide repeat protein [Aequorivita sp. S2608]MDS1297901.1 tetratricopeptide repeat protein [Aequorivita sp. S2608]
MKSIFIALFLLLNAQQETRQECNVNIQTAIEAMHKQEHTKSLELLIKAQTIAQENRWYKELFLSLNNIGANYYKLSDYGEALENYLAAYDVALVHLDSKQEMVVLNNIGVLFYQKSNLKEAENYFFKAYEIAVAHSDSFKRGLYAINLGLVYNNAERLEEAHSYLQEALPLLENNQNVLLQGKYALVENLYLKGEYPEAKKLLEILIPELDRTEFIEQKASGLLLLSKMVQSEGNIEKAKNYALAARSRNNSLDVQILVHQQLSSLTYNNKNYDLARTYKDSVILLQDSLHSLNGNSQFEANRVKFALRNYEMEIIEKTKNFQTERKLLYIMFGGIVILLLILIWAWRSNVIKFRQKKIIEERNQKIKILEMESELEAKNRKLAAKALNLSSRNEMLQEVIQNIKEQPDLADKPEIRQYVSKLNKYLKKDTAKDDFLIHFNETNYGFLSSLREKHPSLNANDIRFISYLYMNLSIKEISSLLNITPDASRKRKERIAKKMNLQETAELFSYLSTI